LFTLVIEFQSSVWEILVANDSNVTNWQEHKLVCNCPFYLNNNLCKHNMALAAALKFVNIPLDNSYAPFLMLNHSSSIQNNQRFNQLKNTFIEKEFDGLNNIENLTRINQVELYSTFTHLLVSVII
jgi:hypothetical protein